MKADKYCPDSLIKQTIQAARDSNSIQHIVLVTDRIDLPERLIHNNVEIQLMRPNAPALYAKNGSFSELCLHLLQNESVHKDETDIIVLLQPEFPFRTGAHIAKALRLFNSGNADTMLSVSPSVKAAPESSSEPNGAIVVTKASTLRESGNLLGSKVLLYEM